MLRSLLALLGLILIPLAVSACDSGDADPTAAELDGIWVNVDAGTVRGWDFAADTNTYDLYVYSDGAAPIIQQSGTYEVSGGRLVTSVQSSLDASIVGRAFANDIVGFTGSTFTLAVESTESGRRTFTRADALP